MKKKLTAKQEGFVNDIISGIKQTQAYKNYYNTSKMKEKTIIEKASRLFAQDNIRARYEELQKIHQEKAIMKRDELLKELKRAFYMALGVEPTPVLLSTSFMGEITTKESEYHSADLKAVSAIAGQIAKLEGWDKPKEEIPDQTVVFNITSMPVKKKKVEENE